MDNMFLDTQFFAVLIRLVWDNWQRFNGEQIDPGDSTDFLVPQMTAPAGGYALSRSTITWAFLSGSMASKFLPLAPRGESDLESVVPRSKHAGFRRGQTR